MTVVAQYRRNPREDEYLLTTLKTIADELRIPVETGVFKGAAPDCYAVLTPMADTFELYADNKPNHEVQEVRISLFDKGNYLAHQECACSRPSGCGHYNDRPPLYRA